MVCVCFNPSLFCQRSIFVLPSHILRDAGELMSSRSVFTDAPVCGPMLSRHINWLKIDIMRTQSNTQDHGGARRSGCAQQMTMAAASFGAFYCTGESACIDARKHGAMKDLVRIRDQFCVSVLHSSGLEINISSVMVTFTNVTLRRGGLMVTG